MTSKRHYVGIAVLLSLCDAICFGQSNSAILWKFDVKSSSPHQAKIVTTATLAPGWHLYSQFLKAGGPIPTHFTFDRNRDYVLSGWTEEKGEPVTFYDEIFEMDITRYSNEVVFVQSIQLFQTLTNITGSVSYMACNDRICFPGSQEFNIQIDLTRSKK